MRLASDNGGYFHRVRDLEKDEPPREKKNEGTRGKRMGHGERRGKERREGRCIVMSRVCKDKQSVAERASAHCTLHSCPPYPPRSFTSTRRRILQNTIREGQIATFRKPSHYKFSSDDNYIFIGIFLCKRQARG